MGRPRILFVSRRTTWQSLVERDGEEGVRRMAAGRPVWFDRLLTAHEDHEATMRILRHATRNLGLASRWVHALDGVDPARYALVVTVGGDGTVLHTSHFVEDTPVLAIRSSRHSAGYLTSASGEDAGEKLAEFAAGRLEATVLQRMSVRVEGKLKHDKVLNEALFSHPNPALTTRYVLAVEGRSSEQMSSGVWVGPAAGSTAAIRSAGGRVLSPTSRNLQWVVREPITAGRRRPGLLKGLIRPGKQITIMNKWQPARLYLDGPHLVVNVEPAQKVSMSLSNRPLKLLAWSRGGTSRKKAI